MVFGLCLTGDGHLRFHGCESCQASRVSVSEEYFTCQDLCNLLNLPVKMDFIISVSMETALLHLLMLITRYML